MSEFNRAERTPAPRYGKYVFAMLLLVIVGVSVLGFLFLGGGDDESTGTEESKKTSQTVHTAEILVASVNSPRASEVQANL